MLKDLGYRIDRQEGSHEQWTHPTRPGRVTVAGADGRDIHRER
jgi:predicted RNA binding protein YcfA (HicA-like mRNA interferase family)